MFGIYRTALAFLVVLNHLGPVDRVGPYAVFAFYVLSGYLMTAVLQQNYGYSAQGLLRYGVNRLLRIVPLYWVALLVSIGMVLLLGEARVRAYHPSMGLELPWWDVVRNALLVLTLDTPTRLVPPAWALTVELFYYALMGLGLSRWLWSSAAWLVASVAYTANLVAADASFSYRYFPVAAASLPFALGSLLHHLRSRNLGALKSLDSTPTRLMLLALFAVNLAVATAGGPESFRAQFYANLVLAGAMTYSLAGMSSNSLRSADAAIGDLSYPVYLLHYQAGLGLMVLGFGGVRGEWGFAIVGGLLTLALAWAATIVIEPTIQSLRRRIRQTARPVPGCP